jgi:UDP-N-acetylmuramyl pentapeptide phosphotransferase/UDP-N-acetylglucosamine-1-phosphate transferase
MLQETVLPLLGLGLAAFIAAVMATWLALQWLRARAVLDIPNARSSHRVPVPRGGGLGFAPVIVAGWAALAVLAPAGPSAAAVAGVAMLAALGFLDDRMSLRRRIRLLVQAAAIGAVVWTLPQEAFVFRGALPFAVDRIVAWIALVWFVNLFNFMDGIDGIAATEGAMVAGGLVALTAVAPHSGIPAREAAVVTGAALGFLLFNRSPAKLFMGDVGSLALGIALGYLLLMTAVIGYLAPAVILPMYFVADASLTLVSRLMRGRHIGEAHRDHAYQRAVDGGVSHGRVVRQVALGNLGLAACAFVAVYHPWTGVALAAALSIGLVIFLRAQGPTPADRSAIAKPPRDG